MRALIWERAGAAGSMPSPTNSRSVRPDRRTADPRLAAAGPARGRGERLRLHRGLPHRPGPRRLPGNDLLPQPRLGEHQHPRFPHVRRGPHGRGLPRHLRRHPLPARSCAPGPGPSRRRRAASTPAGGSATPTAASTRRRTPRRFAPRGTGCCGSAAGFPPQRPAGSTSALPGSRPPAPGALRRHYHR